MNAAQESFFEPIIVDNFAGGGGSIYCNWRNDLASTRLLFLAYSMLLICVAAELRRVGAL